MRALGRRTWRVLPPIAILAYGWTFHMGFLNMYLAWGICLLAVAAAWRLTPKGLAVSTGLLAIAYVAHGLPVALGSGIDRTAGSRRGWSSTRCRACWESHWLAS